MLAVLVANAADLTTFYLVARVHPIAGESNPLVAPLWAVSPLLVAVAKLVGVLVVLLILSREHPRLARWGTALAVAVPTVGALVNTASSIV